MTIAPDEDEIGYCVYCDHEDVTLDPPPVDDDDAWEELATEHAPDCEWIETRAHRVNCA